MADSQKKLIILPNNPLCGISTYKDTLNLATGACTRQIYKWEFNGNEAWNINDVQGSRFFYVAIPSAKAALSSSPRYCSHFTEEETFINPAGAALRIYDQNSAYADTTAFKVFLASQYANGTPVTLYYVLATSEETTIPVPSGLTGTVDGYLNQDGTPTPTNPIYPTANNVEIWLHSLRKLTTATEAVENPLYSDGTAITAYTLKGNEEHAGTPTPSNPVDVQGVGVRTENLWNDTLEQGTISSSTGQPSSADNRVRSKNGLRLAAGTYTIATDSGKSVSARIYNIDGTYNRSGGFSGNPVSFSLDDEYLVKFIIQYTNDINISPSDVSQIMLNSGSTAKPFEPYGYKIPIPNGGVNTNIYLGSTQTVRQIKKYVFTGQENNWNYSNLGADTALFSLPITANRTQLEICTHFTYNVISTSNTVVGFSIIASGTELRIRPDNAATYTLETWKQWLATQYAAGTPVTVWYVLATPQTAAVNEPLMKIGTYADTLSNATAIPTTEGVNSITVDTTIQPSEFTATWTGWHNASVKEYDGSDWN